MQILISYQTMQIKCFFSLLDTFTLILSSLLSEAYFPLFFLVVFLKKVVVIEMFWGFDMLDLVV